MSKSDIALQVENLGKMYRLGRERPKASGLAGKVKQGLGAPFEWLGSQMRPPSEEETLWALKDVSFEIKRGEVVGFIGHNGAGKSTLLKILSRITEPTEGFAEIHGRIAALLEVGTGMHPELSGRENIYMNGTVLGMKKREIDGKFDEIIDFSGIEKFLDTPVKRYSSGMRVRLGFAIAAHLEPEILVVDEVLAVGDADFQSKCIGRMSEVAKSGRTVLFVSHNMGAIQTLCERTIVLDGGRATKDGTPRECIEAYYSCGASGHEKVELKDIQRAGSGLVQCKSFEIRDESNSLVEILIGGNSYSFFFHLEAEEPVQWSQVSCAFNITSFEGTLLTYLDSSYTGIRPEDSKSTKCVFRCKVERFPLIAGKYSISTFVRNRGELSDQIHRVASIDVEKGPFYHSGKQAQRAPFMMDYYWE
ncbi:ABC transporter ATP-binding protein [Akkermansiaceae bacterium]|nr:ABC transporter ATP-binding protein [Akkermansiaceae bacterium]